MDIDEKLTFSSRQEWRAWLEEHHADKQEAWLVIYKSTSGKREFTMRQAQEEALCFGWVDSVLRPMDGARYALRFSPRRKQSHWSDTNKARATKMLREGKMTPAGMALLPAEIIRAWEEENPALR